MPKRKRNLQRLLALCGGLALFFLGTLSKIDGLRETFSHEYWTPQLPCQLLSGTNETLLILRTGATEIAVKLPIHLSTMLRCFQHHILFSDFAETFMGEPILDSLELVGSEFRMRNHDFELYRRLQKHGREALVQNELSGSDALIGTDDGHTEIPGWKLDRWKFLPMVNRTFFEHPDMKWYVFIEADTHLLWSTVQSYLAQADSTKASFFGVETYIDGTKFAHGGSGFILSQPALRMYVHHYTTHKAELERFTEHDWAGDCVLGKTLEQAGVSLTSVWPLVHGESTGDAFFAKPSPPSVPKDFRQVWCYPAGTYHHMAPAATESLWNFEQEWLKNRSNDKEVLRHQDIFRYYIMPQMMQGELMDWDNLNDQPNAREVGSLQECRVLCERDTTCKQYSYDQAGLCKTRINPRLGIPTKGITSGWIEDRVLDFERDMMSCEDEGFKTLPGGL